MAEKQNVELVKELQENAPINWDSAQSIGEKHGLKPRAVVQICVRNSIEYKKKERVSKTGKPVAKKADLVAQIATKYEIDIDNLDGLDKASKSSLESLLA